MFQDTFKGRRVLVTGHTGFKGSWLTQWLRMMGAEVAGLSLDVPTTPANYDILGLTNTITDCRADIQDEAAMMALAKDFQPEIVFHLAAQALVRRSYEEPKYTFLTNLGGTINVLEMLRTTPSVRAAVMITSDKCYENVEWSYGYREGDHLGGKDPYSGSKACAEIAFSSYVRSFFTEDGPWVASARAGNVIGGGDWADDRIVPDCARAWATGESALIRNPHATRPWQHVLEPLSGYLLLAAHLFHRKEGVHRESFNFGPSAEVNHSVGRLVEDMTTTWSGTKWHAGADAAAFAHMKEAGLLKLCCDKALHNLGWLPTLSYEETVEMTAAWYREYYGDNKAMAEYTTQQIERYISCGQERQRVWTGAAA